MRWRSASPRPDVLLMSLRRRDLDSKELWQEYDLHTMEHGASSIDDDGENVKGKEKVLHSGSVRSGLVALYACVFLDLVSVGLVIPLLPYYAEALGASPSEYGALLSFYGILQLFGSPLMGKVLCRHTCASFSKASVETTSFVRFLIFFLPCGHDL